MPLIALIKLVDDTDEKISDVVSGNASKSTTLCDIQAANLDHQHEVHGIRHTCWDKSLGTTQVPLPMN